MKGVDYSKEESEELRKLRRIVAEQEEEIKFLEKATVHSIGYCDAYNTVTIMKRCGNESQQKNQFYSTRTKTVVVKMAAR